MQWIKLEYKRISRWVVRNQNKLTSDRMAEALIDNQNRDFWSEVKKVCGKSNAVPTVMDNVQGETEISELFKKKYSDLYNCVSYEKKEMDELLCEVTEKVSKQCGSGECYCNHVISVEDVKCAVNKIKANKSGVNVDMNSNHIIHGCDELNIHLSFLYTTMMQHAYSPKEMLLSALVPIPKNRKKSLNDSNNYRSIALSSIIGKVLDNIIIMKHSHVLSTSNLQFGFKPRHSTTQCTYVMQEVIDYYVQRNSSCYTLLLDATKVFDRVQYVKLFRLLLQKGICLSVAKLLLCLYTNQSLVVRWSGKVSEPFECSNGIKQGGVLSPILFCIYMDELLHRLEQSGYGCYIGN